MRKLLTSHRKIWAASHKIEEIALLIAGICAQHGKQEPDGAAVGSIAMVGLAGFPKLCADNYLGHKTKWLDVPVMDHAL